MNYLLDTCVISEIRRKSADTNVCEWVSEKSLDQLYLSVITLGEIQSGIRQKIKDPIQQKTLTEWLEKNLIPRFSRRILGVDMQSSLLWGDLIGAAKANGEPVPVIDALIAATAQQHKLVLATRNVTDFERFPLTIVNPWEA